VRSLAPAADGGSQLKEKVSCESGPSAWSEDANVRTTSLEAGYIAIVALSPHYLSSPPARVAWVICPT
jgi:hypothetical protein